MRKLRRLARTPPEQREPVVVGLERGIDRLKGVDADPGSRLALGA